MKSLIIIMVLITSAACGEKVKTVSNPNTSNVKVEPTSGSATVLVKPNHSSTGIHDKTGKQKLSCCVAPPSRFKIKAVKK